MKKSAALLLSALLIFTGCSLFNGSDKGEQSESLKIKDLFPFSANTYYYYEGVGINYAEWEIYNEYINGNRLQRKIEIPGTTSLVEVLEISDGELKLIYGDSDYYEKQDFTNIEPEGYQAVLKEPIELGAKWNVGNGITAEITDMKAEVQTPYGSFKAAIEVTKKTFYEDGTVAEKKEYYVSGLGMVKMVTYNADYGEIISQLALVEELEE